MKQQLLRILLLILLVIHNSGILQAQNPDIYNIYLSDYTIFSSATTLTLFATANDNLLGNDTIQTAQCRLDSTAGPVFEVLPLDGAYDETNENLYCVLDPSALGWQPGEFHQLYIRATDAGGNNSVWTNRVVWIISGASPSDPYPWTHYHYTNNPVMVRQGTGWEQNAIRNFCIITNDGLYKMWYTGYGASGASIGYAESDNGIQWTNRQQVIQADAGWETNNIYHPCVIYDSTVSKYKMWYTAAASKRVGYAESLDGKTWVKYNKNPILEEYGAGWESNGVTDPYVIKEGNNYKMWYTGISGANYLLGYAVSTDGTNWIRYPNNPVVSNTYAYELKTADPYVVKNGDIYYLWYECHTTPVIITFASSYDGINWRRHVNNPNVLYRPGVSLRRPVAMKVGTNYKAWYVNGGVTDISYACVDFQGPSVTQATLVHLIGTTISNVTDYTMRAFISDENSGTLHITEAEYFLDGNPIPAQFGTGINMSAYNMGYNNLPSTRVEAVLSGPVIYNLTNGWHTIYIHGRDPSTNNNTYKGWGDFAQISFYLNIDRPNPVISCWDPDYSTVDVVHDTNVQVQITSYGIADYYLLDETRSSAPSTNASEGWIPLDIDGTTDTNYCITNNSADGAKTLYLWVKTIGDEYPVKRTNNVFLDRTGPAVCDPPVFSLSSGQITIQKPVVNPVDDGVGSYYWTARRTNTGEPVVYFGTNQLTGTTIFDTGLTANKAYYYQVKFLDQFKNSCSNWSAVNGTNSLANPPVVVFDQPISMSFFTTNPRLVMTNKVKQGTNGISYYRFIWNKNLSHSFNGTETKWSNIDIGSNRLFIATEEGEIYGHFASYNDSDDYSDYITCGPLRYYVEIPRPPLILSVDKTRVNPDGVDYAWIKSEIIYHLNTGNIIGDNAAFTVSCDQGDILELVAGDAEPNRDGLQTVTKSGRLSFKLMSRFEGDMIVTVTSVVNSTVTASLELSFVPELSLNDVQFYNNVLVPGDDIKAELWYLLSADTRVVIECYTLNGIMIKEWDQDVQQEGWQKFEWDLTRNNRYVDSGTYFFVIKTDQWTKVRKLVVVK